MKRGWPLSLALLLAAASARAQTVSPTWAGHASAPVRDTAAPAFSAPAFRPMRIAKWTTLAAGAGAAVYGFLKNGEADDAYRELEQDCEADRDRCLARLPGGAYADGTFERRYQDVLSLDRKARIALVAGQLGIAASVVLFLLDLRHDRPPPDIPYVPSRIEVRPDDAGGVRLRLVLPAPRLVR